MVTLTVCIGSACHLRGSYNVINTFQQLAEEFGVTDKVELKATFCLKHCTENSVSVMVNDTIYSVSSADTRDFFEKNVLPLTK